jgi:hypothetical protein
VRSSEYIKSKLFEVAYRESDGKAGVYGEIIAWSIANRVRRGMGNWIEVLKNVPRYRAAEPISDDFPDLWNPQVTRLLQSVDSIYENQGEDLSHGGIYYAMTEKGVNDWFKEFVIDSGNFNKCAIQNSLCVWGEKKLIGGAKKW